MGEESEWLGNLSRTQRTGVVVSPLCEDATDARVSLLEEARCRATSPHTKNGHHSGHLQTHSLAQSLKCDTHTRAVHAPARVARVTALGCVSQQSNLCTTSPTTVPAGASLREVVQGVVGKPSVWRLRAASPRHDTHKQTRTEWFSCVRHVVHSARHRDNHHCTCRSRRSVLR